MQEQLNTNYDLGQGSWRGELCFGIVRQLWSLHLFNSTVSLLFSSSLSLTLLSQNCCSQLTSICTAFRPPLGPDYWFLCRVSSALRRTTRTCPLFKCKQFAAVGFALPPSSSAWGILSYPVSIQSRLLNVLSLPCRIISPDIWSYHSRIVASSPNPKLMGRLVGSGRGSGICSDSDRYAQMSRSRCSRSSWSRRPNEPNLYGTQANTLTQTNKLTYYVCVWISLI